ncbi:TetR/AcrR family transcriptional regulator [Paractinoplanes toevensis]|uniref:HTH tetR-type domain-containing protein n=1 Tax=Paractinoplanes toevensis TaxID=571911 RepID=A0A919W638_9ACTN|nr:TetR/AcrR family transcriptional regulator [Actinoplanes toevensis]GIM93965.1 hypothetical protein Ato02nite_057580 [Actinoplanes toevensis]
MFGVMVHAGETEASLVVRAAEMFGRDGYAATSLDEVGKAAGLSRGAVYHHFGTKATLFRYALIYQERRLAERFVAASSVRAGWDAVRAGCAVVLDAYLDPALRRILLIDGPAVLGWQEVRSIEDGYVGELLRRGLQRAAEEGGAADLVGEHGAPDLARERRARGLGGERGAADPVRECGAADPVGERGARDLVGERGARDLVGERSAGELVRGRDAAGLTRGRGAGERVADEQDVEARLSVLRGALAEAGLLLARDEDSLPALTREIELLISTYERNPALA